MVTIDTSKYFRVVEDIGRMRIHSSTKAVFKALDILTSIVLEAEDVNTLVKYYPNLASSLVKSRPASALMSNIIRDFTLRINNLLQKGGLELAKDRVREESKSLKDDIKRRNNTVAIIASRRISDGSTIMTYSYSTVVKTAIVNAIDEGKYVKVYIPESRPGSEGLEMAEELSEVGADVTVFVDSATRYMMKDVDIVLISSEAVAANRAVVNKVGTSLIALAANEARVRVFALAQTLKFYPGTFLGELIELGRAEPRSFIREEVVEELRGVEVYAPVFDVTPPEYIDAIVTERGLVAPQAVVFIIRDIYGWPPKIPSLDYELKRMRNIGGIA
ncbi:MAG: initiation factor 2B [Thermoprotei archaeon]|nr:MAG: initiation factor 2B [Thermoprotei archaeon]